MAAYRKGPVILFILLLQLTGANALELQPIDSPAIGHSAQPHLATAVDGRLVLSWLEHTDGLATLKFSQYSNNQWHPGNTIASGRDWFVNWADFPSVTPIKDKLWAAHWLHKRPGGKYAYDVAIALSNDNGASWSSPITPHTDGTATEHGFVSLFPWQNAVGALWLDGRNMTEAGHAGADGKPVEESGMTLRSAIITADGKLDHPQVADGLVCDCCQTDIALLPDGPVAIYRNRTPEEIRDIQVTRSVNGQWQKPVTLGTDNWHIAGCPVNGPAISAQGETIAAAWFTGAAEQPRVRLVFSDNAGSSFGQVIDIDDQSPVGRVDVELLPNGDAAVLWACTHDSAQAICLKRVGNGNRHGPTRKLEGIGQFGGFPQLAKQGDNLILAWSESQGEISMVKTAILPVSSL